MSYEKGKRYQVIKEGAKIWGMKPSGPGVQQGYRLELHIGDILTCNGTSMTFGDGVPALKWLDA